MLVNLRLSHTFFGQLVFSFPPLSSPLDLFPSPSAYIMASDDENDDKFASSLGSCDPIPEDAAVAIEPSPLSSPTTILSPETPKRKTSSSEDEQKSTTSNKKRRRRRLEKLPDTSLLGLPLELQQQTLDPFFEPAIAQDVAYTLPVARFMERLNGEIKMEIFRLGYGVEAVRRWLE
jgi:hypothetical protein